MRELQEETEALRRRLLSHYDAHARDLPWRRTDDPYAIWVSEIMLQQTRVETVLPYYRAWLERFPDVETLAEAEVDDVLKAWEGLGYYRRARHLHRAAGVVRERFGGNVPASAEKLRELPGVGPYTAGAVASIAFGEQVPAVDGNVRRVLARIFDLPDPTASELRDRAAGLVDPERPGDFNQALMELGATVCTPSAPGCADCPVEGLCQARARGTVEERPRPRERARPREVELGTAVVAGARGRMLLVRRPEKGLLAGLWSFPVAEPEDGEPAVAAAARAARNAGVEVEAEGAIELAPVPHAFTHIRATYRPFLFRVEGDAGGGHDVRFAGPAGRRELALPVAQRQIGTLAREALGVPDRGEEDGGG